MAFSTEFIMGAGGGSGTDLSMSAQAQSLSSTMTTVGEPYVVDKAGVYGVAVFGNISNVSASNTVRIEFLVNGAVIETGATQGVAATVSFFQTMYLAAGDTITMRASSSGLGVPVLYEPTVAVAPIDTVGDGTAHAGGPVELPRDQWTTLASHTVARSGVILVDYGLGVPGTAYQSRIAVNGQERIGNPVRVVNERWYRALSVNAGDVVAAQAYSASFSAPGRVVNNWTISFR